jgi:hypothetical protein
MAAGRFGDLAVRPWTEDTGTLTAITEGAPDASARQ